MWKVKMTYSAKDTASDKQWGRERFLRLWRWENMEGDVKSLIFSFHCLNPLVFRYELCSPSPSTLSLTSWSPPPSKWGIKKRVKFLLPLSKTNLEFILIYLLFFPLFAVHTSPSFTGWSGQVFPPFHVQ